MSESEIDYSNTIIYKITCKNPEITDKYVGHTIDFSKRKYAHMNNTNSERSPCYNLKLYKFIRDNGGWDNWKMDIVNFYNCTNLREAKAKEQEHYIELQATLNSIEPLKAKEKITKICNDVSTVNKSESRFYCKECDITFSNKVDLKIHISTSSKHIQEPVHSKKFICKNCNIGTDNKKDFGKHLVTIKHKNICDSLIIQSKLSETSNVHACGNCNIKYKSRVGLWYHNKKCKQSKPRPNDPIDYTSIVSELVNQNNYLKNTMLEQALINKNEVLDLLTTQLQMKFNI